MSATGGRADRRGSRRACRLAGTRVRLGRMAAAAALPAALVVLTAGPAVAAARVNGGGSSFQAPEAQQWAADVARAPYDLNINYVTSSSGAGRDFYAQGQYDFGASDIVYNPEDGNFQQQAQQQHPFKYVTVSAGGLAFQYDLVIGGQRFTGLDLTPAEVCGIFTGEITQWSQLARTTGDAILASFDQPIEAVVRSDSAGESYVLSQYCEAVEPGEWATFKNWVDANAQNISYSDVNMAAGQPVSFWPGVLYNGDKNVNPQSGATAASEAVANPSSGNGSITYEASAYAKELSAPVASVENAAGYFVQPDANSVQIALSYARPNAIGTFDLDFAGRNPDAYFPSTYSYVIDPSTTNTVDKGINGALDRYLCYAIGQGQNEAAPLLYAPLSAQVTAISVRAIESTPGAPPASQCGIGGPQPHVGANGTGVSGNNGGSAAQQTTTGGRSTTPTKATSTGVTGAVPAAVASASSAPPAAAGATAAAATGPAAATGTPAAATGPASGSVQTSPSGGGSDTSAGAGAAGGAPAGVQPLSVQSAAATAAAPIPDQALWWVLGGALLAAAASWLSGSRRRSA